MCLLIYNRRCLHSLPKEHCVRSGYAAQSLFGTWVPLVCMTICDRVRTISTTMKRSTKQWLCRGIVLGLQPPGRRSGCSLQFPTNIIWPQKSTKLFTGSIHRCTRRCRFLIIVVIVAKLVIRNRRGGCWIRHCAFERSRRTDVSTRLFYHSHSK